MTDPGMTDGGIAPLPASAAGAPATALAERVSVRVRKRILPYVLLLYIVAFLDRVNVGYAALDMTRDLGFDDRVYGLGAGIFFLGYFLLEIPGTLLVENWSARKWIARIMITWGIVAVLMGFVRTAGEFYTLRFVLGLAEAGFFPGIVVYLTHWFRAEERARALSLFVIGIPLATVVGAPISGLLLQVDWFGLAGWRWLFILEGFPAVILGISTLFYLTDRPAEAKWLAPEEREWLARTLAREREGHPAREGHLRAVWRAVKHRDVVLLALAYFLALNALYGMTFWMPLLIKRLSGFTNLTVAALTTLPYAVGVVAMLLVGRSSDRSGERRQHTSAMLLTAGIALLATSLVVDNTALVIALLCLTAVGVYGYIPSFWPMPYAYFAGSAAAAAVGFINSVGNLGGFVGPYIVGRLSDPVTGELMGGIVYLGLAGTGAAIAVALTRKGKGTAREKKEEEAERR